MDNKDMKKLPLDEAELEQVGGGININQVVIVSPDHALMAVCPQCSYARYIFPTSTLGYCPDCHVPLVIKE